MEPIGKITDLETLATAFDRLGKDCCIGKAFRSGLENPERDLFGLVDDARQSRSTYYFGIDGSYIRTFDMNGEVTVDFGRRCRHIPYNSSMLADQLNHPIIVPLLHPAPEIGAIRGFENLSPTTRHFEISAQTPHFRQCFLEPGVYSVGIIKPGWKTPQTVYCID